MTEEQIRQRSQEKIAQVQALMKVLHVKVEAKERIVQGDFIEKIVLYIDSENYPLSSETQEANEAAPETVEKEETKQDEKENTTTA